MYYELISGGSVESLAHCNGLFGIFVLPSESDAATGSVTVIHQVVLPDAALEHLQQCSRRATDLLKRSKPASASSSSGLLRPPTQDDYLFAADVVVSATSLFRELFSCAPIFNALLNQRSFRRICQICKNFGQEVLPLWSVTPSDTALPWPNTVTTAQVPLAVAAAAVVAVDSVNHGASAAPVSDLIHDSDSEGLPMLELCRPLGCDTAFTFSLRKDADGGNRDSRDCLTMLAERMKQFLPHLSELNHLTPLDGTKSTTGASRIVGQTLYCPLGGPLWDDLREGLERADARSKGTSSEFDRVKMLQELADAMFKAAQLIGRRLGGRMGTPIRESLSLLFGGTLRQLFHFDDSWFWMLILHLGGGFTSTRVLRKLLLTEHTTAQLLAIVCRMCNEIPTLPTHFTNGEEMSCVQQTQLLRSSVQLLAAMGWGQSTHDWAVALGIKETDIPQFLVPVSSNPQPSEVGNGMFLRPNLPHFGPGPFKKNSTLDNKSQDGWEASLERPVAFILFRSNPDDSEDSGIPRAAEALSKKRRRDSNLKSNSVRDGEPNPRDLDSDIKLSPLPQIYTTGDSQSSQLRPDVLFYMFRMPKNLQKYFLATREHRLDRFQPDTKTRAAVQALLSLSDTSSSSCNLQAASASGSDRTDQLEAVEAALECALFDEEAITAQQQRGLGIMAGYKSASDSESGVCVCCFLDGCGSLFIVLKSVPMPCRREAAAGCFTTQNAAVVASGGPGDSEAKGLGHRARVQLLACLCPGGGPLRHRR